MLITHSKESLPKALRDSLNDPHLVELFTRHRSYEEIRDDPILRRVVRQIGEFADKNGLVVFHCSKELFPGKYLAEGLRVLNQERHVDEFLALARDGALLTEEQIRAIEPTLRRWRDGSPGHESREGTLHLLHGREEALDRGAQKFFTYYGGEALYWPFGPWEPGEPHWFLKILERIGEPVVVEARVDPKNLISGSDSFGADVAVSYFGREVNPEFEPWGRFCLTKNSISPTDVITVVPLSEFREEIFRCRSSHRGSATWQKERPINALHRTQ